MSQENSKPAVTYRSGALQASVFEREHQGRKYYSTSCSRSFTRDDGKTWEYSDSFGESDLPVVAALMIRAWEWIIGAKFSANVNKKT